MYEFVPKILSLGAMRERVLLYSGFVLIMSSSKLLFNALMSLNFMGI